jgi:hypothetical protein
MPRAALTPADPHRQIRWAHGCAELQTLGGMLAPVTFRATGQPDFSPLQVAPWADEPQADRWPGALRRLRGEWPCVPFGRCDRPDGLPADWAALDPGDAWGHGHASHHDWAWLAAPDALSLALQIDLPADQAVARMTRIVRAMADAPALEVQVHIEARRDTTLPVALHPTLRLDLGRVQLALAHAGPGLTYPVPAEPGRSRVRADARFERLQAVPLARPEGAATQADFSRYPQPVDSEDLLLLMGLAGPVSADYLDAGWRLTLDWDRSQLPDLMLWVSHRGRLHPPWNGRHWALGVEPLNGAFDLGRVARPPAGHPLAARPGLPLRAGQTTTLCWRLSAQPLAAAGPAAPAP